MIIIIVFCGGMLLLHVDIEFILNQGNLKVFFFFFCIFTLFTCLKIFVWEFNGI